MRRGTSSESVSNPEAHDSLASGTKMLRLPCISNATDTALHFGCQDTERPSELDIGDMSIALQSERRKCNILTAALEHAQGRLDELEAQLQRSRNR
eukprot:2184757-Rhodomonas_salina.1